MSKTTKIAFCGLSDMGRQRSNNEDAFVVELMDDNAVLAVVIDGVGGYEGGEVAAAIAQKEIPAYLKQFKRGERLELLKQAVTHANNAIYEQRQKDEQRPNMSCVLTSALVDVEKKVIDMVHVGDTRLYQFHHGVLTKLSHDHSLVGYREEMGDLTEEQAMHHPKRNEISRDVGSELHEIDDRDFLEAEELPLQPNSILLLCSDGLTDLITSKQIVSILEQNIPLKAKNKMLVDAANEAGGKDNVTVVLVEYCAEEPIARQPMQAQKKEEKSIPAPQPKGKTQNVVSNTENSKSHKLYILVCAAIIVILIVLLAFNMYRSQKELREQKEKYEQIIQGHEQTIQKYDRKLKQIQAELENTEKDAEEDASSH